MAYFVVYVGDQDKTWTLLDGKICIERQWTKGKRKCLNLRFQCYGGNQKPL